jgi:hypothetical protein
VPIVIHIFSVVSYQLRAVCSALFDPFMMTLSCDMS